MTPYSGKPLKVKARKAGEPTPPEMTLLSGCARNGHFKVEHNRGHSQPPLLTLAFEMQERGWLQPPGEPEVRDKTVRVWTFRASERGLQVYRTQLESFGVKP